MEAEFVKKAEKVSEEKEKKKSRICPILLIICILAIGGLAFLHFSTKTEMQDTIDEKVQVAMERKMELDSIMMEYEGIKSEYGQLNVELSEKDSIIQANAEEIKKLIARSADYRRIKKQRDYLRSIIQDYVNQIDSLFTVNKELKEENQEIKRQFTAEKKKTQELQVEIEEKTGQVEIASMLKAYNISAKSYKLAGNQMRERETYKANRVDRIKICFTLSQNLLAEAGNKTVYIRIARPDSKILTRSSSNNFMFNGELLSYSLKKDINYQNHSMELCLNWDKVNADESAMKGTYNIAIFVDGYEIGQSSFTLE